jgi:predicted MFS family arabinose efflux permease
MKSNSKKARFGSLAPTAVASELAVMFMGATLPTPLYPLYREAFSFSGVTLTLIYAAYVLGNLAALLIFGRLSDQLGRRPTTLPAIGIGLASTLVFVAAGSAAWLFAARILSGFATGLASGAATAWIAELQPGRDKAAAVTAAAANFIGLAAGPLLAGALAQFAAWPLRLSYIVYLPMLGAIAIVVLVTPETVAHPARRTAELSLRPRLGVPKGIRLPFLSPAVTAFATFALIGFYAALIPNLLAESLHKTGPVVAGLVVFELFAVAALTTVFTGNVRNRSAMLGGLVLLPPGLGLLVLAELQQSMPLLLVATAIGGNAAALGYRGSLAVVNAIAPAGQRSEIVSTYLVAVYGGNSLPVIGIGLLSAATNATFAHCAFGIGITVLAGVALVVGVKYARPTTSS